MSLLNTVQRKNIIIEDVIVFNVKNIIMLHASLASGTNKTTLVKTRFQV